jgi:recombinational DNA repair ATPase RecF
MQVETFDLSHDITLVYGANGTGKSSFCEALETAMLGSISEAQSKRVEHRLYCNNARLRRHVAPNLTALTGGTAPERLKANESEYRFCFIEKNRLDDFARIAARTPADQRQLLATLFGVDQFADFVRGFNQSLDESLTLVGPQATMLKERRQKLASSEQVVRSFQERTRAFQEAEARLAESIRPGATYLEACEWLLGTGDDPGRLAEIQGVLDRPNPTLLGVSAIALNSLRDELLRVQGLRDDAMRKLSERAGEVSFSKLYEAVLALSEGANACPACGTDLANVKENPFERAKQGLVELNELATLQTRAKAQQESCSEAMRSLWSEVVRTAKSAMSVLPEKFKAAELPQVTEVQPSDWFNTWNAEEPSAWSKLLGLVPELEALDRTAKETISARNALVAERQRLDPLRLEVERARTLRSTAQVELETAQQTIAKFDEANQDLIQAVAVEKVKIALHERIKAAYDSFLPHLQRYLSNLPGVLMQGLNDQARDLYNSFNRGDQAGDLISALHLPQAENGKIEIEFVAEPGTRYDALIVLSEGHIKCLGLAILLAKNISQKCPVVIFDDVVNAIDDEHRDGIWRTFFEDGHLDGKQVILTSHAQEFLFRIQQELGAARAAGIRRYKFLPHQGRHELRVDSDPPTKNYVLLAKEALNGDERRDAMKHSRPALEALTDQLWKWLGTRGDGRLELKLSGPSSPWELNNKCQKLRQAVSKVTTQYPDAEPAVAALVTLTGLNGSSIEWSYLNGGVHDSQRDHEFDGPTVQTIVEAVVTLDDSLGKLRKR